MERELFRDRGRARVWFERVEVLRGETMAVAAGEDVGVQVVQGPVSLAAPWEGAGVDALHVAVSLPGALLEGEGDDGKVLVPGGGRLLRGGEGRQPGDEVAEGR